MYYWGGGGGGGGGVSTVKEGNVRQLCEHMDAQLNCMTLDLGGGGGGGGELQETKLCTGRNIDYAFNLVSLHCPPDNR